MKKLLIVCFSIILIYFIFKNKEDLTIIYNIKTPTSYSQGWVDRYNQPYNPRWFFLRNYFYPVS